MAIMIGGGIRCFGHLMKFTTPCVTNRLNRTAPRLSVKYLSSALGESKSKDSDDSELFGNIELPVEEKIVFNKFDLVEDDNDEQDAHDAKVGDIFRPGKDKFHRKLNYLIHDKRDLRAALNVLETEMREERVQPEQHHFRILIHACAKVGHCEKAFRLYNSFKKRLLKRHVGIYTDLFHSCTNCPDPQYALTQAHWLRRKLAEDHFIPSPVLYNSMIQAFGRTGDLETAFELLDEMKQNQVAINHITFDFLLQGCISDKENGFRHALMTWRAMRKKTIWPRIHNYNLMLRAAEECRLGDISHSRDIILACLPVHEKEKLLRKEENKKKYQQAKEKSDVVRNIENRGQPVLEIVSREEIDTDVVPVSEIPNLLSKRPTVDTNIVGLSPGDTPQSRLMLMGGASGLVELMKWDRVQPNIKTFDQLLRIIPNTKEEETKLITLMKDNNIKPDVSFCNQVIILRETRGDLKLARQTLDWMAELEIKPDIMTFGALARCCKEPAPVFVFLRDCHQLDVKLNSAIMTTLVTNMAIKLEPRAVKRLLEKVMHERIKVDRKLLLSVERFFQTYRSHVKRKEMGLKVPHPVHLEYLNNKWENWIEFVNFYNKKFLPQVRPDLSNPLDQYKSLKDVKDEEYNATQDIRMLKDPNTPVFEEKWPSMRPTILKLLRQEAVTRAEWHDLFWLVHSVCLWDDKGPPKVYGALREDILDFIKQAQERVLSHQEEQALLKAYIAEWRKFFTQCSYLPMPFGQLETALQGKTTANVSKKAQADESVVRKLMLDSWNQSIFSNIKQRLQDSAMKLVHSERTGEAFDSQLVIGVRESYVNLSSNTDDKLQIYRENFEKAYIDATESFYRVQAPDYLRENGVQNYMTYADSKLREEEQRASKYLESCSGSVQNLIDSCVSVLVTSFKDTILAECAGMIRLNETEKLQMMFKLLDRVPDGIDPMLAVLEAHIYQAGIADMVANAEVITADSEKYVEQLLELFNRFSLIVKDAFKDDPRFLTSRDKAYKKVVNDTSIFKLELPYKAGASSKTQPESKCPELLANYCDMLLRKTPLSKKLTSDEVEAKLHDVLLVLKYVQNKDVFMRYHKAHLTRRLILDTSADSEKEENMVEWLREVGMPADFINKLSRMFQDIKVSEDLNNQFKDQQKLAKKEVTAEAVSIKILNIGAWARTSERVPVTLPRELEDFIPEVEEFYKSKHSGRKLQWHHHMSNGTITFANKTGKFDLEITTFQMAALFCWENRREDRLSLENLRLATELPDAELRKTLWSLVAFPKLKRQVLLAEPSNQKPTEWNENTVFWINQDFALVKNGKVQRRGRINLIGRLQLSTEKTREEENQGILQLRILRTQEAIIKILKMRKRISNAQLQTELVDILKNQFLPSKKLIKEQIEWLIEHKYMKRDDDNINMFIYMA